MENIKQKQIIAGVAIIAVCFVIIVIKSFMGVNWGDEVFHLSLMHRFAQGDIPFIDEWNPSHVYAIPLSLIYSVYVNISGSNDGIILVFRILMNSITAGIAVYSFIILIKKDLSFGMSIFCSMIQMFYAANGTLGMTYYMLAYESILLALLIAVDNQGKNSSGRCIIIGFLFGIAITSNPFLIFFSVVFSIVCVYIWKDNRKQLLFIWIGILLMGLICFGRVLYNGGSVLKVWDNFSYLLKDPTHDVSETGAVFKKICVTFHEYFFLHGEVLIILAFLIVFCRLIMQKEIPLLYKRIYF